MEYQILYDDETLVAKSPEERDAYAQVLKDIAVSYTVEESYLVAIVRFQNDNRIYTYFTDRVLPDGTFAVVESTEWRAGEEVHAYKIVTVVRCTMRTKTDLEKVCPFTRYKYILGTVTWN